MLPKGRMKNTDTNHFSRSLSARHIQLISLGGTIGVGLFYGSATAIKTAGPAIVLTYLIVGFFIFLVLKGLGEMLIHNPITGSFTLYSYKYLGPFFGFLTGWTYWFMWLATCIAEVIAIGKYMQYWFPNAPSYLFETAVVLIIGGVNLLKVKVFGELEFWAAIVKILAILGLIVTGLAIIIFGFTNNGTPLGFSNLWLHDGFFPKGENGFIKSFCMATYAFLGIEMIAMTAGEAKDPVKNLPKAINKTFWRILFFYAGAMFIIVVVCPWDTIGMSTSPFVTVFKNSGIKTAAGLINFVVITAALSSCNSGIFSVSRTLYTLAAQGEAPRKLIKLSSEGIPSVGVIVSSSILMLGVVLDYLQPDEVFIQITAVATTGALWTWLTIIIIHLKFKKKNNNKAIYTLPMFPYSNYLCIAFIVFIVVVMLINDTSRIPTILFGVWIISLSLIYFLLIKKKSHFDL